MNTITVNVELEAVVCCVCGIPFGIPGYRLTELQRNGGNFWCPNGHAQEFTEPEVKKLRRELGLYKTWYEAEHEDHEKTRRSLSATRGVLTRTKKRVAAGVCPCCHRHFVDLERHMAGQHPDYAQ